MAGSKPHGCVTDANLSLSSDSADYVCSLESENPANFPEGSFSAVVPVLKSRYYAVDSTWISHTFAVKFLVLRYVKEIADGKSSFH